MAWTNLTFSYGAILTSSQMTQLYNNITTVAPLFGSGKYGTLIGCTKFTANNATWSPNAATKTIIAEVVGGGGAGGGAAYGSSAGGEGGHCGARNIGISTSVSGTYAIVVGAGGAGVTADDGGSGSASSVTGTGLSVSAAGGLGGVYNTSIRGSHGDSGVGVGGVGALTTDAVGGAAAANSGAGGGGSYSTTTNRAGGAGGSGVVYIWEFA